eukprot:Plantae.Rhodophyta-Purpureofilum_apyrenoidigerum.ctg25262.p1 GENE.Plantae.Rhodophyta-Purpureofilum_apyrenoidigerum.ctg25262~~Plantae.Rhodophyta-Purpureofilum_apyrenoidigerum.ctg25262.p1  ORF type:complete len:281 (+),score=50.21 Plantae.Rhodophyta-Purpureofilum_apyrenoidigerum.ctg25262:92-934(+)
MLNFVLPTCLPSGAMTQRRPRNVCSGRVCMTMGSERSDAGTEARRMLIVAAALSSGSDVLFPGAFAKVVLDDKKTIEAVEKLDQAQPVIGHFFVETSNQVSKIGTRAAVVDTNYVSSESSSPKVELTCLGMSRLEMIDVVEREPFVALVKPYDDLPTPEDLTPVQDELLRTISDVISLSFKLTVGEGKSTDTLTELNNVVESLKDPQRYKERYEKFNPRSNTRLETVSFLIADLLDQPIYERRRLLESKDTRDRMEYTTGYLEAQRAELAAKVAVMDAVG